MKFNFLFLISAISQPEQFETKQCNGNLISFTQVSIAPF